MKQYSETINITKGKRGNLLYGDSLSLEEALYTQRSNSQDLNIKIRDISLALRKNIHNESKQHLPDDLHLRDIESGEVDITEISGPDIRQRNGNRYEPSH